MRARVTAAAVVVAAVGLGIAAAVLALVVPRAVDGRVTARVEQAVQWQAADARRDVIPVELSTPPGLDLLQVVGADGEILGNSAAAAQIGRLSALSADQTDRLYSTYRRLRLSAGPGDGASRYYVAALKVSAPRGPVTVYGAEDVTNIEQAIRIFYAVLVVAVPVLLLMVGLAAWTAVGMGLRPVEKIRSQLEAITGSDLSRRVPRPDTGDEIAALAATTNDTLARLERSAETQRRFVGDASHELRSPVTALCTQLDVAVTYPQAADWPSVAARSLAAAERLSSIIDELLMMARLNAGVVAERRPVDLGELAKTQAAHRRQGRVPISVDAQEGAFVLGSSVQLDRLLTNLLDNADRHARRRVELTVTAADGQAIVMVTDDGNGIAPQDREKVFERFTRLRESRERDKGGSGLGLALAREVAEAHHGTLTIADHTPGARFVARFPLAENPDEPGSRSV